MIFNIVAFTGLELTLHTRWRQINYVISNSRQQTVTNVFSFPLNILLISNI